MLSIGGRSPPLRRPQAGSGTWNCGSAILPRRVGRVKEALRSQGPRLLWQASGRAALSTDRASLAHLGAARLRRPRHRRRDDRLRDGRGRGQPRALAWRWSRLATSPRGPRRSSSKMVHGGLRYLQQREFRLVYENLHERQRLLENAPHLVRPLPFLIPLFGSDGVVSKAVARSYKSALWLYDLTGGHQDREAPPRDRPRRGRAPLPHPRRLEPRGGLPLLRRARRRCPGGPLPGPDRRGPRRRRRQLRPGHRAAPRRARPGRPGAVVRPVAADGEPGREHRGLAPGSSSTRPGSSSTRWAPSAQPAPLDSLTPAKGVHVTVPARRLPCDVAAVIPVPEDHRSIFVVPWEEGPFVYLGHHRHRLRRRPPRSALRAGGRRVPPRRRQQAHLCRSLAPSDVTGGLGRAPTAAQAPGGSRGSRRRTADLSRRHKVETGPDGMVTITGGKWTTYRKMAEDAGDEIARQLPGTGRSRTRRLALHGAQGLRRRARGLERGPGRAPRAVATAPTPRRSRR